MPLNTDMVALSLQVMISSALGCLTILLEKSMANGNDEFCFKGGTWAPSAPSL